MVDYPVIPDKTALILIGLENDWLKRGAYFENAAAREKLVPKLKQLKDICRAKGIRVIYVRHVHRRDGSDVGMEARFWPIIGQGKALVAGTEGVEFYETIKPEEGDIVVDKHRYSGFYATDLDMILRNEGIDTLIIAGSGINVGLETTARDAAMRDYKVIFPSDGNLGGDMSNYGWGPVPLEELRKVVLTGLARAFAQVISIKELLSKIGAADA